jgi:hypothetical protein
LTPMQLSTQGQWLPLLASCDRKMAEDSLIFLSNTSIALLAMLAPEWPANHAGDTKVRVVKLASFQECVNHGLLLIPAPRLRDESRILDHGQGVEECTERNENAKSDVLQRSSEKGCWKFVNKLSTGSSIRYISPGIILVNHRTQTKNNVPAKTPDRYGCEELALLKPYRERELTVLCKRFMFDGAHRNAC